MLDSVAILAGVHSGSNYKIAFPTCLLKHTLDIPISDMLPAASSNVTLRSFRTLRIEPPAPSDFEPFDLALYDGAEVQALTNSVAARVRVPPDAFYLTASTDRYGTVVPLTAALPDGMRLVLHRTELPPRRLESGQREAEDSTVSSNLFKKRPADAVDAGAAAKAAKPMVIPSFDALVQSGAVIIQNYGHLIALTKTGEVQR